MTGLSPVFGRLSDRVGSRLPATVGMLLAAAGAVQMGLLPDDPPAWRILLALGTVGIGMAAFSAPNTSSVMGAVPRSQLSLASGFLGTLRTAGQEVSTDPLGDSRPRVSVATGAGSSSCRRGHRGGHILLRPGIPHSNARSRRTGGRRSARVAREGAPGRVAGRGEKAALYTPR